MIKKFSSLILIVLFAVTLKSAAQVKADTELKIGYMNVQEVINQLPQRAAIETQLKDFISKKQEQLKERATDYQNAVADYNEQKASLSEQQQKAREQELAGKENDLNNYQQSLQAEIQRKRSELLSPVYDSIDQAIADVAKKMQLDFVLSEQTGIGDKIIYYSSEKKLNITQNVLEIVKNKSTQN